jgi:hypothetical protein
MITITDSERIDRLTMRNLELHLQVERLIKTINKITGYKTLKMENKNEEPSEYD